jgi:ribosomal protein S18 acetylase RimI-like enzyme
MSVEGLTLRLASPTDAAAVLAVIRAAFTDHQDKLDPPSSAERKTLEVMRQEMACADTFVICTPAGAIVACILARQDHGTMHWERLAVDPNHRGDGLASQLMDRVEQRARELNIATLRLEVRLAMTHNRSIYERRGYTVVDYGSHDGYDAPTFQTMEKSLSPV